MKKLVILILLSVVCFAIAILSGCMISSDKNAEGKKVLYISDNKLNNGEELNIKSGDLKEADEQINKVSNNFFFNKPSTRPKHVKIIVFKESRVLELYGDDKVIGRFKIGLGGNPSGDKNKEGDSKTPEGEYYICSRNDKSQFCLFLGLSYPNSEDAQRGLSNDLIDKRTFGKIKTAEDNKQLPPWDTPLGGAVGIHGGGSSRDWTLGCIALEDEEIKILWEYTKLKTPVLIYE